MTQVLEIRRAAIGARVYTGEICPEGGIWRVDGFPTTMMPIKLGTRMPPFGGKAVAWVLVRYN